MTLTPEQIAQGWKLHDGSDVCPIKDNRTLFAFFNRLGGCAAGVRDASSLSWLHQGSSSWDIIAYRIIEAHGADAATARPTPYPNGYDELVWDDDGWSQTIIVDGKRPEWLRDDDGIAAVKRKDDRSGHWSDALWEQELAIRVRRREPKRETVTGWLCHVPAHVGATRVSYDLIDGKPDLSTLKIAEDAL